jgi:hypothetical protein
MRFSCRLLVRSVGSYSLVNADKCICIFGLLYSRDMPDKNKLDAVHINGLDRLLIVILRSSGRVEAASCHWGVMDRILFTLLYFSFGIL